MQLIIHFKEDADIARVADYMSQLPPIRKYKDVIEKLELPEPEI